MFSFVLVLLLSILYSILGADIQLGNSLLIHYVLAILFVYFVLKNKNCVSYAIFNVCFLGYGLLTLITQQTLINNPFEDFYIHNDAAWSFYSNIMEFAIPNSLSELTNITLLNPYFYHYPLAAYIFGGIAKLGLLFGIDDIRLLLRMHCFTLAALIVAQICALLHHRKISVQKNMRLIFLFSFCTYLYVSSGVFTRDIHVCFLYSLMGYIMLKDTNCKLIKLVAVSVLMFGMRPQNGMLAIAFVLLYYLFARSKISTFVKLFSVLAIIVIVILGFPYINIEKNMESFSIYHQEALSQVGGVFQSVYALPFPINKIAMLFYMCMQPLPVIGRYMIGTGGSYLTIPFVLSPYVLSYFLIPSICYSIKNYHSKNRTSCVFVLIYFMGFFLIIFGSPDLRRAFAVIPGLFMAFFLIKGDINKSVFIKIRRIVWPIIAFISIILSVYVVSK